MSFFPRQRPAPLLDDDEDAVAGNGDGSVPLDSLALLLATAYLLAYLALHTLTGWASIATAVPLTAALLYHWYHDKIPRSTAASIEREQAELSAMMKAAVVYCSQQKKRGQQQQQRQQNGRSSTEIVIDEADGDEQRERTDDDQLSLRSPHLSLQLTSPNAHSHPIELADDAAAGRSDRKTAGETETDEGKGDEEKAAVSSSSMEQYRAAAATTPTTSTRSSATGAAAASVLSPKTPTTVLDATET